MKPVWQTLFLGMAVTVLTIAHGAPLHAQQPDQDSSPSAPARTNPAVPQAQQNEAQMPASGEATTRDAKTFTGRVVKENGGLVLKDPVTKVTYKFEDDKAKQYVGKQVKVTGKLNLSTNTIEMSHIEPLR